jgi:hypothetical protein
MRCMICLPPCFSYISDTNDKGTMKKTVVALLFLVCGTTEMLRATPSATSSLTAFQTNAGVYSFDIFARQTSPSPGEDILVGTSQFFIAFNNAALASPSLSNINPRYSGTDGTTPYRPMEVALIATPDGSQRIVVTIKAGAGPYSLLSTAGTLGERICTVSLTITDPTQTANLGWDTTNSAITSSDEQPVANTYSGSDGGLLPIQLASFTATVINPQGHVRVRWRTLTETNNYGFYVQRSPAAIGGFHDVSELIPGHGTTIVPQNYSWTDLAVTPGTWFYRLRQIDLDGTVHYSEPIRPAATTEVAGRPLPTHFSLGQNYPNPFNPMTRIEIALPHESHVRLEVYNVLGQRMAMLLNDQRTAGYHIVEFDGRNLPSGMYFYRMTVEREAAFLKTMILVR